MLTSILFLEAFTNATANVFRKCLCLLVNKINLEHEMAKKQHYTHWVCAVHSHDARLGYIRVNYKRYIVYKVYYISIIYYIPRELPALVACLAPDPFCEIFIGHRDNTAALNRRHLQARLINNVQQCTMMKRQSQYCWRKMPYFSLLLTRLKIVRKIVLCT